MAVRIGRTIEGLNYAEITEDLIDRTEWAVRSKCLEKKWHLPVGYRRARRPLGINKVGEKL